MVHCLCGQAAQAKQIHITIQPKLSGRDTGITGSARPWPQAHPNLLELPSSSVRRGNLSKFTINIQPKLSGRDAGDAGPWLQARPN